MADGFDELLGVVAGDAEELPAMLEGLERGVRGRRLLSRGRLQPARLHAEGPRRRKAAKAVHAKLQSSRAFFRSLFARTSCSDEQCHGIGVRARSRATLGQIKNSGGGGKAPFGQIKNS